MRRIDSRDLARLLAVAVPALAGASLAIGVLEEYIGVPTASAVYLAAVVATALVAGTTSAPLVDLLIERIPEVEVHLVGSGGRRS